ncbi:MAG: D-aminoacyl-tRNA deacylase [Actinomycetota bacterium]
MRVVLQRVSAAQVTVDDAIVSSIGQGLLVLIGIGHQDDEAVATTMAKRIASMRVFSDPEGKMNLSVTDIGGEVLVVSQFTLLADVKQGRRPSFMGAAAPDVAERLIEAFASALEEAGLAVGRGVFGAHMQVSLTNDGPVTIVVDGVAGSTPHGREHYP